MVFCKRFFIICFSSIYFFTICNGNLLAVTRKNSKTKSKSGRNAKKRSVVPTTNLASQQDEASTQTEVTSENVANTTQTTNTTVSNNLAIDTTSSVSEGNEEIEVVISEDQQLKTVPTDEKWEDFKFCMQQQCMGGPEQPLNVECYKTLNFDNAFQSCKVMIGDVAKHKTFERYFQEIFLIEEQEKACQTMFSGTWNKVNKTCDLEITFTRKYSSKVKTAALKNDKVGCNDNKKKLFSFSATSSLKLTCSHDIFGLDACYSDPVTAQANDIGLGIGIGTTIVGVLAGTASGVAAGLSTKGDEKYNDEGKVIGHETATAGQSAWNGISTGLQAGTGMIMEGVGQIVTAKASSGDVGPEVTGTCKLPDGVVYTEGSVMQISW